MTIVFLFIAALVALALLLVGREGSLPEAVVDQRPEGDPRDPRFDVVLRGYRMDEVDAKLAELQEENARLREDRAEIE